MKLNLSIADTESKAQNQQLLMTESSGPSPTKL